MNRPILDRQVDTRAHRAAANRSAKARFTAGLLAATTAPPVALASTVDKPGIVAVTELAPRRTVDRNGASARRQRLDSSRSARRTRYSRAAPVAGTPLAATVGPPGVVAPPVGDDAGHAGVAVVDAAWPLGRDAAMRASRSSSHRRRQWSTRRRRLQLTAVGLTPPAFGACRQLHEIDGAILLQPGQQLDARSAPPRSTCASSFARGPASFPVTGQRRAR